MKTKQNKTDLMIDFVSAIFKTIVITSDNLNYFNTSEGYSGKFIKNKFC